MAEFKLTPLDATFGAVVTDIQLAELDEDSFKPLYQAWLDYALLIFPGQFLSREDQQTFAERFGELEFPLGAVSNVRQDGSIRGNDPDDDMVKVLKGNMGWHCDSTYMPVQAKGAVFSAEQVPSKGGETGWADMRAAYTALSEATREKIADLKAYHSLYYSQAKMGHFPKKNGKGDYAGYGFNDQDPPLRPLVKIHPETKVPALMIGRHAYGIPGMDPDESERFLAELTVNACQAPRIYHHRWAKGDLVAWDNRALMHQACPWDMTEARTMVNCRIAGSRETEYAATV